MKKLLIEFLIVMTIVSVLYTLYLKSRREKIAQINDIVFDSSPDLTKTDEFATTDPLSSEGLVTTAKENAQALQSGMNDRYEQAKSVLDLSSEPPPPILLSEEMRRKKERAWKHSGGDGVIDQLLDNVKSVANSYEQSAVKRCDKAHSSGDATEKPSESDSP